MVSFPAKFQVKFSQELSPKTYAVNEEQDSYQKDKEVGTFTQNN